MRVKETTIALFVASGLNTATAQALVSSPGETAVIPSWDLQSSTTAGTNLETLSTTGLNTTSWHHIGTSKCTLMACLVEAGVYNETELFFSDNLRKVDDKQFLVPWVYRHEFTLNPTPGQHFFLQTHGISSRADIFLNGREVASSAEQAGSFVGRSYDITNLASESNALAIQVYPTDYYRDFALGWVDWNPWPADNGTGVWRDVEIKQTGPVRLDPLRIVTQLSTPIGSGPANVTLKARAQNLENNTVTITAVGIVAPESGGEPVTSQQTISLPPLSITDITLNATIEKPQIWWPYQWGSQPLYNATLTVTLVTVTPGDQPSQDSSSDNLPTHHHLLPGSNGPPSDSTTATFGLRTVATTLNSHNDTTFYVNSRPIQILGAGYSPPLFLNSPPSHYQATLHLTRDMGLNTIRLEGKPEHPSLYALADQLGILLLPGWECCDKWEAWSYNPDLAVQPTPVWSEVEYAIAEASMAHEGAMMQKHPSVLGFVIGSDYYPDEKATAGYLRALRGVDWQGVVVASASMRGSAGGLAVSGMKMEGPYDWVPPGYWFDTGVNGTGEGRYGAAFGFGSELGAGVGTPELGSLNKFLGDGELEGLWKRPTEKLFHLGKAGSQFETRELYNAGLWKRWGAPASLEDYLMKAQLMDYEATRAQVEAYTAMWNAERPATGMIYWMLNNAWPGLHWNLWDYYMRPAGAYFGAKIGARVENVVFDPVRKAVWLVNRSLDGQGERKIEVQVLGLGGKIVYQGRVTTTTTPNTSKNIASLAQALGKVKDVVLLRLVLSDRHGNVLSRNVYWVAKELDTLDWENSDWWYTPVTKYADYTALNTLARANITVHAARSGHDEVAVTLENHSGVPAFFLSLDLVERQGRDVLPLMWDDNYVTLWPRERITLRAKRVAGGNWGPFEVHVMGKNVEKSTTRVIG